MTDREKALEEFDRFCRFIDGMNMNGFVENDFMSKAIQSNIRAALQPPPMSESVREAIEYAEYALMQTHRPPVAGLVVLGQETVKTLITAAQEAERLKDAMSLCDIDSVKGMFRVIEDLKSRIQELEKQLGEPR